MAETKKIHDAIIFAAKAHEGQRRKGTDIPYITHPFEVAQILMEAGCDETLIIAGLLHDTLEDTEVTAAEIEEQFGPEVLALVDSDSEDKSLSWEDRKKHTIEYLRDRASLEELLLACADKLANMRSIKADYMVLGDKVWDRFHRGKEQQSWYYSSLIDVFDGLSDYEMYWEISNLYTDVFVSYYLGGELGDRIYQSSGIETYCYTEEECRWTPVSTRSWKKLEPKLKVISKKEAIALEDAWRDQYPSLMCLVHHRHDTDVIVDCAKRLLDEGKDPSWFEGMWDNMGGGIPADTLRALECAFVALYTRNRGLSR